jgi:hypothetical protein
MSNLKSGKLPRPPLDPIQSALDELKRLPESERFSKGQAFLRTIIEEVLKRPHLSAAIEEAALLVGKNLIEAIDLRADVERAAMKSEGPPVRSEVVRVICDPEIIGRMRASGPRVISEYNPFDDYWMGRRG